MTNNLVDMPREIWLLVLQHLNTDRESIGPDERDRTLASTTMPKISIQTRIWPLGNQRPVGSLRNLRATCKDLANNKVLIAQQFRRIVIRFRNDDPAKNDLRRLMDISSTPKLAREVRDLTFLLPRFFLRDRAMVAKYLDETDPTNTHPSLRRSMELAQNQILQQGSKGLHHIWKKSFISLVRLKNVRILRQQTNLDEAFLRHLRRHATPASRLISYTWDASAEYALPALFHAIRLSCAAMQDASAIEKLTLQLGVEHLEHIVTSIDCKDQLFSRLTTFRLILCPSGRPVLREQTEAMLRKALVHGHNLEVLQLGHPGDPKTVSLARIFPRQPFRRLRELALDGWHVDGRDIVEIVRKHKMTLRRLQLSSIILDDNETRWRDILIIIRAELRLNWFNIRDIDYTANWLATKGQGYEVEVDDYDGVHHTDHNDNMNNIERVSEQQNGSEIQNVLGNTQELGVDDNGHANSLMASTCTTHQVCSCSDDPESIRDDGRSVDQLELQFWETWSLGPSHCSIHGSSQRKRIAAS